MGLDKGTYDWLNEISNNQRRILNYLKVIYDQVVEVKATSDVILDKVTSGMTETDVDNLKDQLRGVIEKLKKGNPVP